jgi:hypothetical protein
LPIAASPFFTPFSASFSVFRGPIPLGKLELEFTLDGSFEYSYRAHTQPGFLIGWFSGNEAIEESRGQGVSEVVVPKEYSYRETNDEEDDADVRFDWKALKAYTSSGGVTWAQEIESGTQDRLSQQLMVRLELARGKKEVAYQVADGGKLKHYLFRVVEMEPVNTPLGEFHCLKVERSKESRKPDYTIWFAPELDYLPVRIERRRSGNLYKMVLETLEGI